VYLAQLITKILTSIHAHISKNCSFKTKVAQQPIDTIIFATNEGPGRMARKRVFSTTNSKKTTTEMKPARDLAGFGGGP